MPLYYGTLAEDINGFEYNGTRYEAGDSYEFFTPCETLGFINAAFGANPNRGFNEDSSGSIKRLENECPDTSNQLEPQTAPVNQPREAQPNPTGGDSPNEQGAPQPETSGTIGQNPSNEGTNSNPSPDEEPERPPEGDPHPTHSGEQPQQQTEAGDPVDVFNGVLYLQETDLEIPNTVLPMVFTRFYRSGAAAYGPFGWNWDHNHNLYVRELNNGDIALWRNLHEDIFVFDGADFEPPRGIFERLTRVSEAGQAFEISGKGGVTMRFERPAGWIDGERIPVVWMRDRHGNQLTYSYGAEHKLAEVKDDDGRFFQFGYDQCGLLVSVEDQAGRRYTYDHNEETQQLTCVTSPPTTDHPKGITRIYHYEKPFTFPELRHNILRVEDSEGRVYLENKYEQDPASWSYARVTEQLYGGYLFQFRYTQLQWVPPNTLYINIPAVRVEVMNPDFGLETYTFNYRGDLTDHRWRLNKDKSFRVVIWQYEYDEQGNLSVITKPDGSREINTFDATNPDPRMRNNLLQKELTSATGFPAPSRIIWKGRYESNYQLLVEEENERGAVTKYRYDFDLIPAASDNSGKLKQIIYPDATLPDGTIQNSTAQFEHNPKGQIIAKTNPDDTRSELVYGVDGNEKSRPITSRIDPGGLTIENHTRYDHFGFPKEQVDGNGNSIKSAHNALGQLEQQIEPAVNGVEATTFLHYNADKKLIATEKPKGSYNGTAESHIIDRNERDVLGYPSKYFLSENTSEKRIFTICNDYRGNPIAINNPDGSVVKRIIDERGLLVYEEQQGRDEKKVFSKKVYDKTGRLIREINTAGLITIYHYDGFGRVVKVDMPNGSQVIKSWGENNLLLTEEIIGDDGQENVRLLRKINYEYDEKDRKIKETINSFSDNPEISVDLETRFFYDEMDRLVKKQDFRGAQTTLFYDNAGRLIRKIDAEGNEERHILDNNGNIIRAGSHHKEPSGATTVLFKRFTYDTRNRRIQLIEPDGAISSEEWDDRGLLIGSTNLLGVSNEIQYNSFGEKTGEIFDPAGLAVTHQWSIDNMGRLISYRDPDGQVSKYNFDTLGRLEKIEYPNGFSSYRTYNSRGSIHREELGSGVIFEYAFDAANRVVSINNPHSPDPISSVPVHQFRYDGLDRVVSAASGTNRTIRAYDSLGRLTSETTNGDIIRCNYDDIGGFVDKIWPDGRVERYTHNLTGTLIGISQTSNGSLGAGNGLIANFFTSGPNHFSRAEYQNNFQIETTYDDRKRPVELTMNNASTTHETIKYRYDTGNRKRIEALVGTNPRISQHDFDRKNRLVSSKHGLTTSVPDALTQEAHDAAIGSVQRNLGTATVEEGFFYNNSDERLRYSETGHTDKSYSYVNGHRVQSDGTSTYSFHTDGTLSNDGTLSFRSDAMGRVIRIERDGAVVMDIEYDAFGRPSILRESGKPKLSFNYLGNFVEQENHNDVPYRQLTLHPLTGVPIAYHVPGDSYYPLFDGRFNLIGLADTDGNLLETYRYRSFGLPAVFDASGAELPHSEYNTAPVFGGQRYLDAVGLYLSTRRLMDPVNGMYLSPDPMGYADSPSLYVYTRQNPVDNMDPHGDAVPLIIAAFAIGGALLGAGYSAYDASNNPNRYEGWQGSLRVLGNVFGAAVIGTASIVAGEIVLASGGVGIFASGTGSALTTTQAFVLYGTSTATSGVVGRHGFNSLFPEYVDPVTNETIARDYAFGGGGAVAIRGVGILASRSTNPIIEVIRRVMFRNEPIPHTFGDLPKGVLGSTDEFGNITMSPGLSHQQFTKTLMHEGLHRYLSVSNPGRFNDLRRAFGIGGYWRSHLLRYLEEGLAQSVGTGSFRSGFGWINSFVGTGAYRGLSWNMIIGEGLGYLGTIGTSIYGLNQLLNEEDDSQRFQTSSGETGKPEGSK